MVLRPSTAKAIRSTFLRKKRKFPHSPCKTQWHFTFSQQQALQNLKKLSLQNSPVQQNPQNPSKTLPFLLKSRIDSFNSYNCEPTPTAYQFIIKTLIQNSQFTELNHVLSHLQKVENFETPESILVNLIRVYGKKGMIHEAIDLFFKIPSFRCVPTVNSLNSLILILCRNREFLRFVPQLLLKSRVLNIQIEESSFSILISTLCRIGRVDYGLKLLKYMIDDDFNPDDKICSLVLSSLCKQKGMTSFEVINVMEDMKGFGFCLDRADFYNVIKFLVQQGKGKDAFDVLCEMKREGIKPDIACYTMVLHGLVEEGVFPRVEELFDEILVFGLVPDVHTYNAYINGLCKQKKTDSACAMISYMQHLGCQPDLVTYKTVLEAYCKFGELRRAREVWKEIKRKGVELDLETYRIMIEAFVTHSEASEACNMLEELLSNSSIATSSSLDDIIGSMCRGGLVSEALNTFEKAYSCDDVPGCRAWEALLLSLNLNRGYETDLLANLVNLHEGLASKPKQK